MTQNYHYVVHQDWYASWMKRIWPWFFPILTIHIWVTAGLIFTRADGLEPVAFNYFWSPLLAWLLLPIKKASDVNAWSYTYKKGAHLTSTCDVFCPKWERFAVWVGCNRFKVWWFNIFLGVVAIPLIAWPVFKTIDVETLHPMREAAGRALRLGGHDGLVIAVATVLSLATLIISILIWTAPPRYSKSGKRL